VEARAIHAVVALLDPGPLRDVTLDQIAERAGLSRVTLYRRWPTRLALFTDALLDRMTAALPLDAEMPPLAAIAGHVVRMVRALQGPTGALARAVVGEGLADPAMTDALRERYLGHRRAIAIRIIARGMADGSFGADGAAEARHDLLYGGIWYRFLFATGPLDEAAALRLFEMVLAPAPGWRRHWSPPA
jgi:AcrR family transcriptional regulator